MKIAVLGPEGTFSDKAYLQYKNDCGMDLEPVYCPTIDEVFEADCDLAIAPIENTLDGYVMRTLDLLLQKEVHIIDENKVDVQFSLIANAEDLSEIDTLYVQFKASAQCIKFINSMKNVKIVTTESNMESFYKVGDTKGVAAIVPHHVIEGVKDKLIVEHVTDAEYNQTRFVVFEKGSISDEQLSEMVKVMKMESDANVEARQKVRIPVYIMPAVDRPGVLYLILKSFYENKINLISIMSRPTKQEMGAYNFYIEIEGLKSRMDVIMDTLGQIQVFNDIKVLGVYNED